MSDTLALSFSAFATGFSLNWLLWSVRHRRHEAEWRRRVESAYQAGVRDGADRASQLAQARAEARRVALITEVPRWEGRR